MSKDETPVYGKSAALAVFQRRPHDIVRVFYAPQRRLLVGDLLRYCATHRLPYRELSEVELSRVAQTNHHEGLVVVAWSKRFSALGDWLNKAVDPSAVLLALENIGNPHNLGAILRSAAAFGVDSVVVSGEIVQSGRISSATMRVAEGGAELVSTIGVSDMGDTLLRLKRRGIFVAGTDAEHGVNIFSARLPRPVVVVLGNEGEGATESIRSRFDTTVHIPTVPGIQSLNVSAAAAVLMAELWRTR